MVAGDAGSVSAFCSNYLNVFNTGIHYSFIASVAAMLISLSIFLFTKRQASFSRKESKRGNRYIFCRGKSCNGYGNQAAIWAALFAVLGIAIFFWFSFHQNGTSLSLFARDFVKTDSVQPEIWQALNPFYVIILTPVVMWVFAALARRGKAISTPRKIAIGMGLAGLAFLFMTVFSIINGYPSAEAFKDLPAAEAAALKTGPWVLFVLYFFLNCGRAVHFSSRSVVRF